jgi:HSP20 family protein
MQRGAAMNPTIDETILRVEQLYTTLTGAQPPVPNGHRAAFPPEIDPVTHVQDQLGRMVATLERVVPTPSWVPRVAAWQDAGDPVFALDIPGVTREHLEIRREPRGIVIAGRRRVPARAVSGDATFGSFARAIPLPAEVKPDQIAASLEDGVLTIRIHVVTPPQPSPIAITTT